MKGTFLFCFLLIGQFSYSQVFEKDTILFSGTTNNRINLILLGDGYQQNELSDFSNHAKTFANKLFSESPYKEYKNYFNVFAIKVPSNESGASHPGTATDVTEPAHPISVVDNYFKSSFDSYGIHRLLVANNSIGITNVLANNFPSYDQVMILVNSPYYGGSGGQFSVASLDGSSNEIAFHELGHSFASLADEYYAGDVYAREAINMTKETNPNTVKWTNWIGVNEIGIYQHCCSGNSSAWYRPHENCKMRYLNFPFCSVCKEGIIERIHSLISSIDNYLPENSGSIDLSESIKFELEVVEPIPNTLNFEWSLNGIQLDNNTNIAEVSFDDIIAGNNQLMVAVEDTTSYLKVNNHGTIHFETIVWNINSSSVGINEISSNLISIELFPNPVQDNMIVQVKNKLNEDFRISIMDLQGKKLMDKNISFSELNPQVQMNQLPSGIYVVNFRFENGLNLSRKIFKN